MTIKYALLIFMFFSLPAFAQRREEKIIKKEVIETDIRIDLNKYKKKGKKNICGSDEHTAYAMVGNIYFPPFSWLSEEDVGNGNKKKYTLIGIGVDYFNHILNKTFKKVYSSNDIIVDSNEKIMRSIIKGSADIHVDTFYDPDPRLGMEYIYPSYISLHMVTVTRKGDEKTQISSIDDLKKYKGAASKNENTQWIFQTIGINTENDDKIKIVEPSENTYKELFTMLMTGEVDYILTNIYSARAEIARYKAYNIVKVNEKDILKLNRLFFAVSKMSPSCRYFIKDMENTINNDLQEDSLKDIVLNNIKKYANQYKNEPKLVAPIKPLQEKDYPSSENKESDRKSEQENTP